MKKLSVKQQYDIYKREYLKKQIKVAEQGGQMFSPMYSEKKFRARYLETKAQLLEDVKSGSRKGVGNVYQYMISDQAYAIDQKMYRGLKKLYKEAGEEVNFDRFTSYSEIRYRASDKIWETVEGYYKQLRIDGADAVSANQMIAQMFFGSD